MVQGDGVRRSIPFRQFFGRLFDKVSQKRETSSTRATDSRTRRARSMDEVIGQVAAPLPQSPSNLRDGYRAAVGAKNIDEQLFGFRGHFPFPSAYSGDRPVPGC